MQHPDLFGPLHDGVVREVTAVIGTAAPRPATIDSARLGNDVLEAIGSWWKGEFPRRLPHFKAVQSGE
jgi:hypothetical protein